MANLDPTGLYNIVVGKLARVAAAEFCNVVWFKDAFRNLDRPVANWRNFLGGLETSSDPVLIDWLQRFSSLLDRVERLVQDAEAVDGPDGCSCSFSRIVSFCGSINHKRELHNRLQSLLREFEEFQRYTPAINLRATVHGTASNNYLSVPEIIKQGVPDQLVSQNGKLEEVMGMLNSTTTRNKWVGICGQGGCGKTVMAKLVNNAALEQKCFERVFFVVVGGAASKKDLLRKLCDHLNCRFEERNDEGEIQGVLHTVLLHRKVLIILDDVWESHFLDLLDVVVDGSMGSRILVTTRNREILDQRHAGVCSHGLLSNEDAKKLFFNYAFGVDKDCPDSLRDCAHKIITQCNGLPLALQLVGSTMATVEMDLGQWNLEAQTIKDFDKHGENMSGLFLYSYNKLTPLVQECFLTMLSWPEDSDIVLDELVLWWRGEDLIGPLLEYGWEEAERILRTLVSRSIIQATDFPSRDDVIDKCYNIHDVILELGLNHLLKDESELKPYEQGHLFLTSKKHRDFLLNSMDQTRLMGIRKIVCELMDSNLELNSEMETLSRTEFPNLKTVRWIFKYKWGAENFEYVYNQLVIKNYKTLQYVDIAISRDFQSKEGLRLYFGGHQVLQALRLKCYTKCTIEVIPPKVKCLMLGRSIIGVPQKWGDEPKNMEMLQMLVREEPDSLDSLLELEFSSKLSWLQLNNYIWEDGNSLHYDGRHQLRLRVSCFGVENISNLRHLDLKYVDFEESHLKWPRLRELSLYGMKEEDGEKLMRMLSKDSTPNLNFICVSYDHADVYRLPTSCLGGVFNNSNLSHLELHYVEIDEFHIKWPRLRTFTLKHIKEADGEKLMRMLSRDSVPNLRFLKFEGDLSTIDNVQPPPRMPWTLEELQFWNRRDRMSPLPAVVNASSLPNIQELYIVGFTVSTDAQVAALHGLQNLVRLQLEGPFPPSLFGFPQVFPQLRKLRIEGVLDEFPYIGEGSLPKLLYWGHVGSELQSIKEVFIGEVSCNFRLKSLHQLHIQRPSFKVLPAAVIMSSCFRSLAISGCMELERLVVEPEVEQEVAASSIKYLEIRNCPQMTLEGIPEVFKRMEQTGKLKITIIDS